MYEAYVPKDKYLHVCRLLKVNVLSYVPKGSRLHKMMHGIRSHVLYNHCINFSV